MQFVRMWGRLRWFPFGYIESVKYSDGHVLGSNHEICKALQAHFCDRFIHWPDLSFQEFRSYFADIHRHQEAVAAKREGLLSKCEVREALKQVGLNKSPRLDSLPYEVYMRLPHMFVPILTVMFNHWVAKGAIPV